MKHPDFLIIGAMKAGTTDLHFNLDACDRIFFPSTKEPGDLMRDEIFTRKGSERYLRLFSGKKPWQLAGEASTSYTMLPEHPDVAERAGKLLGGGLKLIYIVREPVERTVSHHKHSAYWWGLNPDINEAIVEDERLINYSRYAMQIEPWINEFGSGNLLVIRFEDYIRAPHEQISRIGEFLGIKIDPTDVPVSRAMNRSGDIRVADRRLLNLMQLPFYRDHVRPFLGKKLIQFGKRLLLRKPRKLTTAMSAGTARFLIDELYQEAYRFGELVGWEGLLWEKSQAERRYIGG